MSSTCQRHPPVPQPVPALTRALAVALVVPTLLACGCGKEPAPNSAPGPTPRGTTPTPRPPPPPLPSTIEMGGRNIGPWFVSASRDQGECYPGATLPTQVRLAPAEEAPQVVMVRVWAGYEDPVRSRSQVIEMAASSDDPMFWTADVPFPAPYPDEAEIWVEVESADGQKRHGSFNLAP